MVGLKQRLSEGDISVFLRRSRGSNGHRPLGPSKSCPVKAPPVAKVVKETIGAIAESEKEVEFAAREMEHIIRRERRAIEAFEKRSSGGGGVGQILFFIFVVKLIFIFIVVEEGLVKLFFTKRAKMFAKDIPCQIPLFSTTLISYHHVVECSRLARFEAGSILKGKRIKTTRLPSRRCAEQQTRCGSLNKRWQQSVSAWKKKKSVSQRELES